MAVSKLAFFCFSAALATLYENLRVLYCYWWQSCHTSIVQHSVFLCTWQWCVVQQHTQNTLRF